MRYGLLALVAGLLAACGGDVRTVAATRDNVTLEYSGDQESEAAAQAREACAQYNKRAKLRTVNTQPNGPRLAIYDCIPD
jgi:hypothetical protein